MTNQADPITPDEKVLRRIANNKDWIDFNLPTPIQRAAFQPYPRDTDGISLFRELFVTPQQVATARENSTGYYISRLDVSSITPLGLTVIPNPIEDQLPGHSLIPELSFSEYKKNKNKTKEIQLKLARIASENIVCSP